MVDCAKNRAERPEGDFAIPSLRALPYKINGKIEPACVRAAMSRFNQVHGASAAQKASAKSKLIAAAKASGIEVGKFANAKVEEKANVKNSFNTIEFSKDDRNHALLYFKGIVLEEGTYKGEDGGKYTYSADVVNQVPNLIRGARGKLDHVKGEDQVVGFALNSWSDISPTGKARAWAEGVIIDRSEYKLGEYPGLSIEGSLLYDFDENGDKIVQLLESIPNFAILAEKDPACQTCYTTEMRDLNIKLGKAKQMSTQEKPKEGLTEDKTGEEVKPPCPAKPELAKPVEGSNTPDPKPTEDHSKEILVALAALKKGVDKSAETMKTMSSRIEAIEAEKKDVETVALAKATKELGDEFEFPTFVRDNHEAKMGFIAALKKNKAEIKHAKPVQSSRKSLTENQFREASTSWGYPDIEEFLNLQPAEN